jgi:hypothetical protein
LQAASAYDAAAREIRGSSTKFNLPEREFSDALLQAAAESALIQLERSRTARNVRSDSAAAAADEGRHAKLLQELLAEKSGIVRPRVLAAYLTVQARGEQLRIRQITRSCPCRHKEAGAKRV